MRYYITRSDFTRPKNRAQEHIQEFIKTHFNMLVESDDDLYHLIERIVKEIEETGTLHRRCGRMKVAIQNYRKSDSVDIWISVENIVDSIFAHMHAEKVRAVYHPGMIENDICL